MNFEKFTEKSLLALKSAQEYAASLSNASVEECHILHALFSDADGLIPEVIKSVGIDPSKILNSLRSICEGLPKISGSGYSENRLYLSSGAERLLRDAEREKEKMGDEYLSVEHIMLSSFDSKDKHIEDIFKENNLKRNDFLNALKKSEVIKKW